MKSLIRLVAAALAAFYVTAAPLAQVATFIPAPIELTTVGYTQEGTVITMNAAGESGATIGRIRLAAGSGTKTCSSAGCLIGWGTNNVTFANAGTNLRVGLQDVDASTGLEDATFDVRADLVGATDTITGNVVMSTAMETGTKTVSHGDLVAVALEMTARGGTDSVTLEVSQRTIAIYGFPYGTVDSGTLARTSDPAAFIIKFDDGTWGWIDGIPMHRNVALGRTTATVNTGTTPDEYAAVVKFPVAMTIDGFGAWLASVATTDTFELLIYTDPLGTPAVVRTFTVDPDQMFTGGVVRRSGAPLDVVANTYYGFAFRPTSANSITYEYFTLPTNGMEVGMKKTQVFTETILASRTNQAGAFVETATSHLPMLTVNVVKFMTPLVTGDDVMTFFLMP